MPDGMQELRRNGAQNAKGEVDKIQSLVSETEPPEK